MICFFPAQRIRKDYKMIPTTDLLIHTVCIVILPTICYYLYWDLSSATKISKELTFELARGCDVKFEDLKKEITLLKEEIKLLKEENSKASVHEAVKELFGRI